MGKGKQVIKFNIIRAFLGEFLGTFILVSFGCGAWAQFTLDKNNSSPFLAVNWAWGFAMAMGMWVCNGVSGGHINPALSLVNAMTGKMSWLHLPVYIIAQYIGAFCGSGVVYGVYYDAMNVFDGGVRQVYGPRATAQIWATYPQNYLQWWTAFGDQIFGGFLLVLCYFGARDRKNSGLPQGLVPLATGLAVAVIGMSFGINCMYSLNPARDLGPRLFTLAAGWGYDTFTYSSLKIGSYNWFWIPIVGPHVGAILGALVYQFGIGIHIPDEDELPESESEEPEIELGYYPHPPPDYDTIRKHSNSYYIQSYNSLDTKSFSSINTSNDDAFYPL